MRYNIDVLKIEEIRNLSKRERGIYFGQINTNLLKENKKQCSMCGEVNTTALFSKNGIRGGHQAYHRFCKKCRLLYEQERSLRTRKDIKYFIPKALQNIKQRTTRLELPECNITKDYLLALWKFQKGLCFYTGTEINIQDIENPNYFSIDKICPEKGYIVGNIVFTTKRHNLAKGPLDFKEFYDFCESVVKNFPEGRFPNKALNALKIEKFDWPKTTIEQWKIYNPKTKLNEEQVKEIKKLIKEKQLSLTDISKIYKVTVSTVSAIKHNKCWRDV